MDAKKESAEKDLEFYKSVKNFLEELKGGDLDPTSDYGKLNNMRIDITSLAAIASLTEPNSTYSQEAIDSARQTLLSKSSDFLSLSQDYNKESSGIYANDFSWIQSIMQPFADKIPSKEDALKTLNSTMADLS